MKPFPGHDHFFIMKQKILSLAIRPLTGKRVFLLNKQAMKCMTAIILLIACCNSNKVLAQQGTLNVTVVPSTVTNTNYWMYDVLVSAGPGYVTNDNDFGTTNPYGSWTKLRIIFTTPGTPITSGMTFANTNNGTSDIVVPAVNTNGSNFTSNGGIYNAGSSSCPIATEGAAQVGLNRLPPGPAPDANSTPHIIGRIGLKKTIWPAGTVMNLRGSDTNTNCHNYTCAWNSAAVVGPNPVAQPVNAVFLPNNPLPLHLIGFNGILLNGCTTHLSWVVANSDYFSHIEVQYKGDNGDFSTINTAAYDAGNNGKYQFDYNAPTGNGFYRLKVTEMDGSSYYSNMLFITNSCKENADMMLVYPNQARSGQKITMKYNSGHQGTAAIWLTNASGLQYKLQTTEVVQGKNNYNINLPILASGMYYIRMTATDGSWKTPVQKISVMQ